uniref:F-box domain-containing protein n=1 Tax=Macrostomum lignano TaxID=282301 RepID=A0A1I8FBE7_9PLAT
VTLKRREITLPPVYSDTERLAPVFSHCIPTARPIIFLKTLPSSGWIHKIDIINANAVGSVRLSAQDWQLQIRPAVSLYEPSGAGAGCRWPTLPDSGLRALMLLRGRSLVLSRSPPFRGIMYITTDSRCWTRVRASQSGTTSRHRSIRNSASKCANQRTYWQPGVPQLALCCHTPIGYTDPDSRASSIFQLRFIECEDGDTIDGLLSEPFGDHLGVARFSSKLGRALHPTESMPKMTYPTYLGYPYLAICATTCAKLFNTRPTFEMPHYSFVDAVRTTPVPEHHSSLGARSGGTSAASSSASSENNLQHASFTSLRCQHSALNHRVVGYASYPWLWPVPPALSSRIWSAEEDTVLLFCHLAYLLVFNDRTCKFSSTAASLIAELAPASPHSQVKTRPVCLRRFNLLFRGRRSFESLRRVRDSLLVRLRHSAAVRAWLVRPRAAWRRAVRTVTRWLATRPGGAAFSSNSSRLLHRDEAVELQLCEEGSRRSCLMIGGLVELGSDETANRVATHAQCMIDTLAAYVLICVQSYAEADLDARPEIDARLTESHQRLPGRAGRVGPEQAVPLLRAARRVAPSSSVACPPAVDAYFNGCAELNQSVLLGNQLCVRVGRCRHQRAVAALCAAAVLTPACSDLFNEAVGFVADAGIDDIGGASDNSRILRALLDCGSSVGICTDGVCGLSPAELRRRLGLAADTCGLTDRCVQQRQLADLDAELMRLIEARAVFLVGYNMPYLVHRKHMRACLVNLNPRGLQQKLLVDNEKRYILPTHWSDPTSATIGLIITPPYCAGFCRPAPKGRAAVCIALSRGRRRHPGLVGLFKLLHQLRQPRCLTLQSAVPSVAATATPTAAGLFGARPEHQWQPTTRRLPDLPPLPEARAPDDTASLSAISAVVEPPPLLPSRFQAVTASGLVRQQQDGDNN